MKFFTTRKKIVATISTVALAASLGGVAYAYFTATGTGSGTGSVGSTTAWTVNSPTPSGGALYPAQGADTFAFTVTNSSNGSQGLTSVTATVTPHIAGCSAAWYNVAIDAQAATATTQTKTYGAVEDLAVGANQPVSVVLTLTDSGTIQNACQGDAPVVTLTAN